MIEREFIKTKMKYLHIKNRIEEIISKNAGAGSINIEKTPLGERITIYAVRPGLIIGRGGETIKKLTQDLKVRYNLENPQIEVREISIPELDATVVAKQIASEMERFGIKRFKSIGYRLLDRILRAGAMGAEIKISGKVPGKRAKNWLFYKGYLKKCGDVRVSYVDSSIQIAKTNPGVVGIKVNIMHQDTPLPDAIVIKEKAKVEEVTGEEAEKVDQEIKEIVEAKKSIEEPVNKPTEKEEKKEETLKEEKKPEKKEEKKEKPKGETKPKQNNGNTKSKGRKKTVKKGTKK